MYIKTMNYYNLMLLSFTTKNGILIACYQKTPIHNVTALKNFKPKFDKLTNSENNTAKSKNKKHFLDNISIYVQEYALDIWT